MTNKVRQIKPLQKHPRTNNKGKYFGALKDVPDIRDQVYQPTLAALPPVWPAPKELRILDQGQTSACTGFALAAAINFLKEHKGLKAKNTTRPAQGVSEWMLYEMAKQHDEWRGSNYEGSSLRGALRGFYNSGVCSLDLWPNDKIKSASIKAAKDARNTTLGAYYRLRPHLPDYHAALSETGVIYASATVHDGWTAPKDGQIAPDAGTDLHAFIIVGYDAEGFWVQNSWGPKWGLEGIAHWPYKDWAANIQDAWIIQLAAPTPDAFGLGVKRGQARSVAELAGSLRQPPVRSDILGHYVHLENGDFSSKPPYWSKPNDVKDTAKLLGSSTKYDHFLFYAHGGLNSPEAAAIRTAAMTDVFMTNAIYPYSVFYDTGLLETLKDIIQRQGADVTLRTGGFLDMTDHLIERAIGSVGTRLWSEMKADATLPFTPGRAGETSLKIFATELAARAAGKEPAIPIHLVGHSTGAILLGRLLQAMDRVVPNGTTIDSCSLMAPACTADFYQKTFCPRLDRSAPLPVKIGKLTIYNLTDEAEQDDNVAEVYRKSLLYLVSNAFEDKPEMPILGMQKFSDLFKDEPITINYAAYKDDNAAKTAKSLSTSHGGFDNDPTTMNDILSTVLGKTPGRPFSKQDLDY